MPSYPWSPTDSSSTCSTYLKRQPRPTGVAFGTVTLWLAPGWAVDDRRRDFPPCLFAVYPLKKSRRKLYGSSAMARSSADLGRYARIIKIQGLLSSTSTARRETSGSREMHESVGFMSRRAAPGRLPPSVCVRREGSLALGLVECVRGPARLEALDQTQPDRRPHIDIRPS